MKLRIIFLFIA